VLELLKQAIQNTADSRGFLIDGYPREIDQGKMFEAQVSPVDHVVYFQVIRYLRLLWLSAIYSCPVGG